MITYVKQNKVFSHGLVEVRSRDTFELELM